MGWVFGIAFLAISVALCWMIADGYSRIQAEDIAKCVELKIGTAPQCEFWVKGFRR